MKNFLLNKNLQAIKVELKDNLIFKYENKISKKIATIVLISELILEKITNKGIDKNFISDVYLTEKSIILILNCCVLKTFKYEDIDKVLYYLSGENRCLSILSKNDKSDILMKVPTNNNELKEQENILMDLILSKNDKIICCQDTYKNEIK